MFIVMGRSLIETIPLMGEICRRFSKNIPLKVDERGQTTAKNVVFFHYMINVEFLHPRAGRKNEQN
jgi:hypothetical protein